jgi:hypothetical protein
MLNGLINFKLRPNDKTLKRSLRQIRKACKRASRRSRPEGNVYFQLTVELGRIAQKRTKGR